MPFLTKATLFTLIASFAVAQTPAPCDLTQAA
jgi:hypothetical protein